jgi:hypothetical protein
MNDRDFEQYARECIKLAIAPAFCRRIAKRCCSWLAPGERSLETQRSSVTLAQNEVRASVQFVEPAAYRLSDGPAKRLKCGIQIEKELISLRLIRV